MAESAGNDRAADILKTAIEQIINDGLPKDELPLLLSQFAFMFAQVMDPYKGPVALLTYMSKLAVTNEDNPPGPADADDPSGEWHPNTLAVGRVIESLEADSGDPIHYDFSLMAHAMDSLTVVQDMPVEQASAAMVCYALAYLGQHRGIEGIERLVAYAQRELAHLQADHHDQTR